MTTQVKAQHTAGPWRVEADKVGTIYEFDIVGPKGEDIGYANRSDGADEPTFYPATENARLMAAAPALLAVLKAISDDAVGDQLDPLWIVQREVITAARVVIAKAEGQL